MGDRTEWAAAWAPSAAHPSTSFRLGRVAEAVPDCPHRKPTATRFEQHNRKAQIWGVALVDPPHLPRLSQA